MHVDCIKARNTGLQHLPGDRKGERQVLGASRQSGGVLGRGEVGGTGGRADQTPLLALRLTIYTIHKMA